MKKHTKRLRLGIEVIRDLRLVSGGEIHISDIIGGCQTRGCKPGPADDTNG